MTKEHPGYSLCIPWTSLQLHNPIMPHIGMFAYLLHTGYCQCHHFPQSQAPPWVGACPEEQQRTQ